MKSFGILALLATKNVQLTWFTGTVGIKSGWTAPRRVTVSSWRLWGRVYRKRVTGIKIYAWNYNACNSMNVNNLMDRISGRTWHVGRCGLRTCTPKSQSCRCRSSCWNWSCSNWHGGAVGLGPFSDIPTGDTAPRWTLYKFTHPYTLPF